MTNYGARRYYLFFTNSFVYYGLTLNSGSLIPGNLHFNIIVRFILLNRMIDFKPKHDFQRTARDCRQRHHHLCSSLPWTQALRLWQYGNRWVHIPPLKITTALGYRLCLSFRRSDLVRCAFCWLCRWKGCSCADWTLCHNRILLHGQIQSNLNHTMFGHCEL